MSITVAAAAASQDQGWGHLIALLAAALVFWAGTAAHKRWLTTRDDPSPTPIGGTTGSGTKPQVKAVGTTGVGTTSGSGTVATRDIDGWVAEQVGRRKTMEIVREAKRRFGASKMTTLRAIQRVKDGGSAS